MQKRVLSRMRRYKDVWMNMHVFRSRV